MNIISALLLTLLSTSFGVIVYLHSLGTVKLAGAAARANKNFSQVTSSTEVLYTNGISTLLKNGFLVSLGAQTKLLESSCASKVCSLSHAVVKGSLSLQELTVAGDIAVVGDLSVDEVLSGAPAVVRAVGNINVSVVDCSGGGVVLASHWGKVSVGGVDQGNYAEVLCDSQTAPVLFRSSSPTALKF